MTAKASAAAEPEHRFYDTVLSGAEQEEFAAALEMTGLDEEIALLRMRLKGAAADGAEGNSRLFRSLELLVRAVRVKYALGNQDSRDLLLALKRMVERGEDMAGRSET